MADHAVIGGGRRIGLGRTFAAEIIACAAARFFHLGDQIVIIGGIGDDGDKGVVLCRAPHHRRSADIDILDNLVAACALGYGGGKGIEIDDHQIDRANLMLLHRRCMFGIIAHREQAAMDLWVQRLHPPVHHFGKAGQLADVHHLQPGIAQGFGRPAR